MFVLQFATKANDANNLQITTVICNAIKISSKHVITRGKHSSLIQTFVNHGSIFCEILP
jgi:hypothetical protein